MEYPLRAYKTARQTPILSGCLPCTPVDVDCNILAFGEYWKIVLHPWQAHLGSCLLTARRHVETLGELIPAEQRECFELFTLLERTIPQAFGAVHLNISCLMNLAFRPVDPDPPLRDGHPSPHVHWHIFPRYDRSISWSGLLFEDPTFGAPLEIDRPMRVPEEVRTAIHHHLQTALQPEILD